MPTTLDFFKALFGGEDVLEDGYLLITNLKGANKFTKDLKEAVAHAEELKLTSDVYFGTGLYAKPRKKGHGDESDIIIRGFYCLDIDIEGPGHKKDNLPKSIDEALGIMEEAMPGIKPTAVVRSGGGVHLYYAFKEPVEFENTNERDTGKRMSVMFHRIAKASFERHGYSLDNVSNLNRVLRVPGTFNHKTEEKRTVDLVELNPTTQVNEDIVEEFYNEDMEDTKRVKAEPNALNLVIDYDVNPPHAKLMGLLDTNITFKGNWECRKNYSKSGKHDMSGFQQTLANIMFNNGFTDQEICNTLITHRREHEKNGVDPKTTRLDYYVRTITAAHDKMVQQLSTIVQMRDHAANISAVETEEEKEDIRATCLKNLSIMLEADIGGVQKFVGLDETLWEITVNGVQCKIGNIDKLCSIKHVIRRIGEITNIFVKTIKSKDWQDVAQIMVSAAETIKIAQGMSDKEIVRDKIILYTKEKAFQAEDEERNFIHPFQKNGETYIFMAGFREWLGQRGDVIAPKVLSMAMKELGHNPETMAFKVDGRKTTRYAYKLNPAEL